MFDFLIELATITMIAENKETKMFQEAWNHPYKESCGQWNKAIYKEFEMWSQD